MIKLAVFDLDRTMLDDASRLPADFDESVAKLKGLGVQTAIASARAYFSIAELFGERIVNLAGSCDNGNCIFNGYEYTILDCWQPEEIRYLQTFLPEDNGIGVIFSGAEHYYADPVTVDRCRQHGREWMVEHLLDIEQAIADGVQISNCHYICFWEDYPSIEAAVKAKLGGPLKEVRSDWALLEAGWGWVAVIKPGSGKPKGIRTLMKIMQATPDETCVFGDSENDVPMFKEVTHSFAMKNADASVKTAAAYVTEEDNNHNGALKAAIAIASKNGRF